MKTIQFICKETALLLACALVIPHLQLRAASDDVPPEIERAILAEDWKTIADYSAPASVGDASPVLRFLRGHACVALNRNNEAFCLFSTTGAVAEREAWLQWTARLLSRNSRASIVLLLHGDALTRMGQLDAALNEMARAVEYQPRNFLAWNARGAALAAKGDFEGARQALAEAVSVNPALADAYASHGALCIQKSAGAPGAEKAFSRALELCPDFALALNGRAAIRIVRGEWDGAKSDLTVAAVLGTNCVGQRVKPALAHNARIYQMAADEAYSEMFAAAGLPPGTTIDRSTVLSMGPEKAAEVLGANERNMSFNRFVSTYIKPPASTTFKHDTKIVGGIEGGLPTLKAEVSQTVEATYTDKTLANYSAQSRVNEVIKQVYPDIKGKDPGFFGGFSASQKNFGYTRDTGGVSTRKIGTAHAYGNSWPVITLYTLLYDVKRPDAPIGKETK